MPNRVQRTRKAGVPGMPPGSKYVGRGSRWGNPFKVGEHYVSRTAFHDAPYPADSGRELGTFEHPAWSPWPAWTEAVGVVRDRAHAVELFRAHIAYETDDWDPEVIRRELAGRDLACWCALPEAGEPDWCHGAVLLELAASPTPA